jgi:hypothetical protein
MIWRRFAWLLVILFIAIIIWEVVEIKRLRSDINSISSNDVNNSLQSLISIQSKISERVEHIENLEESALWGNKDDPVSWITHQADASMVKVIGVEHIPAEQVSEYQHTTVKIIVQGDYNPLGRFINLLERSPNALKINSFRIKRKEYTPEHIIMDLSLSYFHKPEKSS